MATAIGRNRAVVDIGRFSRLRGALGVAGVADIASTRCIPLLRMRNRTVALDQPGCRGYFAFSSGLRLLRAPRTSYPLRSCGTEIERDLSFVEIYVSAFADSAP